MIPTWGPGLRKIPPSLQAGHPLQNEHQTGGFCKEYICMEQDIHIEDMQESVMQYGRMRKKIEDTCAEIQSLKQIEDRFLTYADKEQQLEKIFLFCAETEILQLQSEVRTLAHRAKLAGRGPEKAGPGQKLSGRTDWRADPAERRAAAPYCLHWA